MFPTTFPLPWGETVKGMEESHSEGPNQLTNTHHCETNEQMTSTRQLHLPARH